MFRKEIMKFVKFFSTTPRKSIGMILKPTSNLTFLILYIVKEYFCILSDALVLILFHYSVYSISY